ncbi:MAG TPA: SLC13 family permease [Burkholderiaceae bacterium]|nr:SLC13 family permease [Burkholderiaceae bacterium]
MAETQTVTIVAIFGVVYLGMILGGLPFVQLDRTGVALLGAIALVAIGALTPEQAALSIHLPTLLLLFSFMVISAQMRLGGFYGWVTLHIARLPVAPGALLAAVIGVVAALSAVFSNDVVCLAIAPVLADACVRRGLDPVPFLLALACSANIGSAATLIGNPQNMLIGEVLELPFGGYFLEAIGPVVLGLAALWALLAWQSRGRWQVHAQAATSKAGAAGAASTAPVTITADGVATNPATPADTNAAVESGTLAPAADTAIPAASPNHDGAVSNPVLDRWQTAKGLTVAAVLVALFLFTALPREVVALTGAGLLLMSRKLHSTHMSTGSC